MGKSFKCEGFDLDFVIYEGCLFQMCIGGSFTTSNINKMSCRVLLAFYAGLRRADLPASWYYKG